MEQCKASLQKFYRTEHFRHLLAEPHRLPAPEDFNSDQHLAGQMVWVAENDKEHPPLLQETLDLYPGKLVAVRFGNGNSLDSEAPESQEFSILLDGNQKLEPLINRFFRPLIVSFLLSEENSILYTDLQAKWLLAVQTYNNKLKGEPGTPGLKSDNIEVILSQGQISDRGIAYSILYILSELLQFIRRNQESHERFALMIRNPLVYQAIRVLYAHTLAVREDSVQKQRDQSEKTADQEALVGYLAQSSHPCSLAQLGTLNDASGSGTVLQAKYPSVRDLLPLVGTKENPVPPVMTLNGQYIHRWQLLNYFLHIHATESNRVKTQLTDRWSHLGVPAEGSRSVPPEFLSEEFSATLALVCQWRTVVHDRSVFGQYFLPPGEPLEIVHRVDRRIFAGDNLLTRKDLAELLEINFAAIAAGAWNALLHREGPLRYLILRLFALFGQRPSLPPQTRKPLKPLKNQTVPQNRKPAVSRIPRASSPAPKRPPAKSPAHETNQTALFQILKNITDIDGEIEEQYRKWSSQQGSSAAQFRKKVDETIIKEVLPRYSFASLTADQGESIAFGLIEKTRYLCEVPRNKHRFLARYIFLVALRHRLKTL